MKYKCTSKLELKQEKLISSMELGNSQLDLLNEILKIQTIIVKTNTKN